MAVGAVLVSVLALCAVGAVTGLPAATIANMNGRNMFLKIVTGRDGANIPVIILPVLVNSKDSDLYETRPNERISLNNLKYVAVSDQDTPRTRSRIKYIAVNNPEESSVEYDDRAIVVAEDYSPSEHSPNPIIWHQPTYRPRKKLLAVIKKPRQNIQVANSLVSSTYPPQDYILRPGNVISSTPYTEEYVTRTGIPSEKYLPVTENGVLPTPPSRKYIPGTETGVSIKPPSIMYELPMETDANAPQPPNYFTNVEHVILSTSEPQQQVTYFTGNEISITPPPPETVTNHFILLHKEPQQGKTPVTSPSVHPPSPSNPFSVLWQIFNYPFSSDDMTITETPSIGISPSITTPTVLTTTEKLSGPPKKLTNSPKSTPESFPTSPVPKNTPERHETTTVPTYSSSDLPKTTAKGSENTTTPNTSSDQTKITAVVPKSTTIKPNTPADQSTPEESSTASVKPNTSSDPLKTTLGLQLEPTTVPPTPSDSPKTTAKGSENTTTPNASSDPTKTTAVEPKSTVKPNTPADHDKSTPEGSGTTSVKPTTSPDLPKTTLELKVSTVSPNAPPDSPKNTPEGSEPTVQPNISFGPKTTLEEPNPATVPPNISFDPPKAVLEEPETTTAQPDTSPNPPITTTMTPETQITENQKEHRRNKREKYIPFANGLEQLFATTIEMIQSYQRERPHGPELPAVVPLGRKFPERIKRNNTQDDSLQPVILPSGPPPPHPQFKRSMRLRIDVEVPRSDFTEAYDIQWHAGSNTVRIVVEDGATVFYRMPLFDGRLQFLKYKFDQLNGNGTAVRRCTLSPLLPASSGDQDFPGLPDLTPFRFIGYTSAEGRMLAERWRHWVIGRPGADGAARGESLNYTHDFLLYRDRGEEVPLKYTVVAHSSILGPYSDTYTHRYRLMRAPSGPMLPHKKKLCQVIEHMEKEPIPMKSQPLRGLTEAPSTEIVSPSGDGDVRAEPATNNGDIAANINIGADHDANLASGIGNIVANINIGAGSHVQQRGIFANINIGAGAGHVANLNSGAGDLNSALAAGSANLNSGIPASKRYLINENVSTRERGTGVASGEIGIDKNGKGSRDMRIGSAQGVDKNKHLTGIASSEQDGDRDININNGGFGVEENLDKVGAGMNLENLDDPNFSLETDGKVGGSNNSFVDKKVVNEKEDNKRVDKDNRDVSVNSTNITGDPSKSEGQVVNSEAATALKESFNPMREYLGMTKPNKYDDLFESYKKKYKRKYRNDEEEAVRKAQFIKKYRFTEAANRIATNFKLGINYMSDRLKEEVKPMVSGVPPALTKEELRKLTPGAAPTRKYEDTFKSEGTVNAIVDKPDFPKRFSWRDEKFNTEVRHQGTSCLSCSLMAATGAVEGAIFAKTRTNKLLSPQNMLDCGQPILPGKCEATHPRDAFQFIKEKGLPSNDAYEYKVPFNKEGSMCKSDAMIETKIQDFYSLREEPKHLQLAIKTRSPVLVVLNVLDGSSPQDYKEGVLDDTRWCKKASSRHSVVAVGYDFTQPDQEHFIFKNSWGADWGEMGYAKIRSGACDSLSELSYPVL